MLGFDLNSVASLRRFQTQFQDLGKIGTGGFSVVNKVRNIRDKKIYALKALRIKPSQLKTKAADYLQKTLSQAKVLSALNHPNILQYHGCWVNADMKMGQDQQSQENDQQNKQQEEELQLVMEQYDQSSCGFEFEQRSQNEQNNNKPNKNIVHHQNLNDNIFGTDLNKFREIRVFLLSQLGESSLQKYISVRNHERRKTQIQQNKITIENYRMILDIIEGLIYLHNQKIIHRDIKLQNIIVNKNKKCKIIDFGLAKKVRNLKSLTIQKFQHEIVNQDDLEEKHSSSIGTKIFSSPEQSNSENYDHRTDIYSLAMLIGMMFSSYNTAHQQGNLLRNLRDKKLDDLKMDQKLKTLLCKCLSQQKMRPQLKQLQTCIKKLLKQALRQKSDKNKDQLEHIQKREDLNQDMKQKNEQKSADQQKSRK